MLTELRGLAWKLCYDMKKKITSYLNPLGSGYCVVGILGADGWFGYPYG